MELRLALGADDLVTSSLGSSAGDKDLLIHFVDGNLLQFGGLLAANAVAGLKGLNVADFAKIADSVKLSVVEGVKSLDLESAVRPLRTLQAHVAVQQAFVLEGVGDERGLTRKRPVFAARPEQGAYSRRDAQSALERQGCFGLANPDRS